MSQEYEYIKEAFFKSISFADTRDYWIEKAKKEGAGASFTYSSTTKPNESGELLSFWLVEAENVFFKPPFRDDERNLYIAFEIVADPGDSVSGNFAIINRKEMFEWKVDSVDQILVLPDSLMPDGSFKLNFGYTLKKDSLNPCYHFYNQSGIVDL